MRSKSLLYIIASLLVLGFTSSVSAVTDPTGDNRVAGYDIISADCVVYPPPQTPGTYMKIGLELDTLLPGIVLFEFDVDNDSLTGGVSSMVGIFNPCVGGGPKLKSLPGIDINVMLMLRDQSDAASTAWCAACSGNPTCKIRGAAGTGCNELDCYVIGAECVIGDPNCYVRGLNCSGCVESSVAILSEVCALASCDVGRIKGEWYASLTSESTGALAFSRGRIETPLATGTDEGSGDCYLLPWEDIITRAIAHDAGANSFDYTKALDAANLSYQLSAWISLTNPTDDFMNITGLPCLEVSDVVPNTGLEPARLGNTDCVMNANGDQGVDGFDVGIFLNEFGRSGFSNPCPVCK